MAKQTSRQSKRSPVLTQDSPTPWPIRTEERLRSLAMRVAVLEADMAEVVGWYKGQLQLGAKKGGR